MQLEQNRRYMFPFASHHTRNIPFYVISVYVKFAFIFLFSERNYLRPYVTQQRHLRHNKRTQNEEINQNNLNKLKIYLIYSKHVNLFFGEYTITFTSKGIFGHVKALLIIYAKTGLHDGFRYKLMT